jgi:dCMP deaminase
MKNCLDGGCLRCKNREKFKSGTAYDLCICVHAEQNALLTAARVGIAVAGGVVYSTMQPCFGCTKEMLQAGIDRVFYVHEWVYPDEQVHAEYTTIQNRFAAGVKKLNIDDPDEAWAVSSKRAVPVAQSDDTGHVVA